MGPEEFAARLGRWSGGPGSRNLTDRLALAVGHAVTSGLLPPGTHLPAQRALASALNVSRPTIGAAFDDLRSRGVLQARQGSGTWVAAQPPRAGVAVGLVDTVLDAEGINLAASVPPDSGHLGPLRLDTSDLLGVTPAHGYDPAGLPALRAACAAQHRHRGQATGAEQILVVTGASAGLQLALAALLGPGGTVVVERYSYAGALDIISALGARAVAVAGDDDGPDPNRLAALLASVSPAACLLMPGINSPTGRRIPDARLDALAAVLDTADVPVIEDQALADLAFDGPVRSLLGRCRSASVVAVESLSKTAWGGLRVGWIRADQPIVERLAAHRRQVDPGSSVPSQLLAVQVLATYPALLHARRAHLRRRTDQLATRLSQRLPEWVVEPSDGGLSIWVRLPVDDSRAFAMAARRHGVTVLTGDLTRADRRGDPHIRLCVDRPEPQLDEAVERLARAWVRPRGAPGLG